MQHPFFFLLSTPSIHWGVGVALHFRMLEYFYKDLNSLRFAFNLTTYFLQTDFDSGKNSDWIINGVMKSDYLRLEYKETINNMISSKAAEPVNPAYPDKVIAYCKKLKSRLPE